MWDLKIDTRRLVEGFSTSVPWDRPNVLWNKADDWWNDNYVTDSNTAAFLSATGIIDPNKQNYINNLVIALKNQGIWNKAKAIYPFVSEQRNLLNNTDTFSGWDLEGGTLTAGFTDPQGGTTAYKFVPNGVYGLFPSQAFTETSTTYTQSIWVKSVSGANVTFKLGTRSSVDVVNLTATGTWQRISNTRVCNSGGSFYLYTISDAAGIYVWHPQMELGNLTDYQVTINAQEQFAAAYKYNLKDPQDTDAAFRLKIFGTWTFSPTGAKPNGTNAYMDTGYNVSTEGTLNSAHISAYVRDNVATGSQMGAYGGAGVFHHIYARYTDAKAYVGINSSESNISSTNSTGFWIGSRITSTVQKLYRNNTTFINATVTSGSKPNRNIYVGATNGGVVDYSSTQNAFASIGDGLDDAEAAALYTIVQQFQTALNRQV
jgi:hypothetical protein